VKRSPVDPQLTQALAAIVTSTYPPDGPGAAVLVARAGQTLLRLGRGMANIELRVPIRPAMVFRLGSITKQFTAMAILMLVEQGKLSLHDEITRFFPDYPTHGHTITVEHLLTHTSGIKSYTSLPEWLPLLRNDLSLQELIGLFKDQPMDFAPDERWSYSNSGYILLGAIIEHLSGMTYAQFIQQHIFDALGMVHSSYGSDAPLIPGRVAGYTRGPSGYVNAPYLSMTQPYAAGSLLSSVDDLARWDQALYSGQLVRPETLQQAFTPHQLTDGSSSGYGYGWAIGEYEGRRVIEHGGGINGFSTHILRMPEERLLVVVLTNKESAEPSCEKVATLLAGEAIGKPYREPEAIALDLAVLDAYVGVYEIYPGDERIVAREGDKLYSQRTGQGRVELLPVSPSEFAVKGEMLRFHFRRNEAGAVAAVVSVPRFGPALTARRTDKPLPAARQAIALDPASGDACAGDYELAPGYILTIRREGDRLVALVPGQENLELWPESPARFFAKTADVQIEFVRDAAGTIASLLLHQGKQEMTARRLGGR
jgi:CubicO group peptidase (beta-lactamase class C family)